MFCQLFWESNLKNKSEETHKKILTVAEKLFAQSGYDATGVADICEKAGVSKGAFYHHFESKQAVFLALLDDWMSELDKIMNSARASAVNVPEILLGMAGMTAEIYSGAKERYSLFLEFWIQASRHQDNEIWQKTIAPYQRWQEIIASILAKGVTDGSFDPDLDPQVSARVMLAMVMGLLLQAFFDPQGAEWDKVTQEGIRALMKSYYRR
jgi:AcrR family transcriptional regulator